MDRRVAQGAGPDGRPGRTLAPSATRFPVAFTGVAIAVLAFGIYLSSGPIRYYNHFVWQALAFLDGRSEIAYPVGPQGSSPGNAFFQDVVPVPGPNGEPTGFGQIPFPPLPALVLLPFVAAWGLATDTQQLSSLAGAIAAAVAWWMLGRLRVRPAVRLATAVFFGIGTVFWYTAQIGTTWYFAHVVAVALLLAAIGIALGGDPGADEPVEPEVVADAGEPRGFASSLAGRFVDALLHVDRRQFLAGLLFGLAATARLPVVFGAPFFMLVGSGGSWVRRSVSAGLGAVIPVGALLLYNLVSTGHLFHPGYEALYRLEAVGWAALGYNIEWAIEDVRYLPQNIAIMLFATPAILPDAIPASLGGGAPLCVDPGIGRGLFEPACPVALPRDIGMSLILTSPAYLLAIPALRDATRSRLVAGAVLAILAIALVNLMHFSQGWVQFGYRFSNDFVPFALLLVALGMERRGGVGRLALVLVAASIAINFWGVWWANALGW